MIEDELSITSKSGPERWPRALKFGIVRRLRCKHELRRHENSAWNAPESRAASPPTARPFHFGPKLSARVTDNFWSAKVAKHLLRSWQLWFNMVLNSARNFKIQTWRFQGFPFYLKWRSGGNGRGLHSASRGRRIWRRSLTAKAVESCPKVTRCSFGAKVSL